MDALGFGFVDRSLAYLVLGSNGRRMVSADTRPRAVLLSDDHLMFLASQPPFKGLNWASSFSEAGFSGQKISASCCVIYLRRSVARDGATREQITALREYG